MGAACCKNNQVQGEPIHELEQIVGEQQPSLNNNDSLIDGTHAPHHQFAKPYTRELEYLPIIDDRCRELHAFQYDSAPGVPRGKMHTPFKLNNGIIYAGEWKNGEMNGKGIYQLPNNTVIYCTSKQNKIVGKGRVLYPDGDYYEGQVVDQKANGYGTYVQGKISYTGEFKDNLPHGHGTEKGERYQFEGKFSEGVKTYGKLRWNVQGITCEYEGNFKNNVFEGHGTLINEEGKYIGTFKNGLKEGMGKLFFKSNSQYYEGQFENNMKNGDGKLIDEIDGRVLAEGRWYNDTFQAQG